MERYFSVTPPSVHQIRILYAAPSVPKCEASNGGVPDNASNFGAA